MRPSTGPGDGAQPDVALLIYGDEQHVRRRTGQSLTDAATSLGMAPPHEIPLKKVSDGQGGAIRLRRRNFAAGDPRHLQGTAQRRSDSPGGARRIHPRLSGQSRKHAARDRHCRRSPIRTTSFRLWAPWAASTRAVVENDRDIGFNGTFLVIRQLEQDVQGFKDYCSAGSEAARGPVALALRHHGGIHRRQADRAMEGWLVARPLSIRKPDRGSAARPGAGE